MNGGVHVGDIGRTVVPRRVYEPEPEQVPEQEPAVVPEQEPVLVPA
jgi:hypothetical protein